MSLTSTELNYLVWRYLQESGYDLAAYALAKDSDCESLSQDKDRAVLTKIEPGCLVNLVQKGILYASTEMEVDATDVRSESVTLLGALMQDEIKRRNLAVELTNGEKAHQSEKASESENIHAVDGKAHTEANGDSVDGSKQSAFSTKKIEAAAEFSESLSSSWHPSIDVFAYGKENSTAVINAIKDGRIVESVTLEHPNILNIKNEINIISWSPDGSVVLTVGFNGEFRAWSSDGRLKNIANNYTTNDITKVEDSVYTLNSGIVSDLIWNSSGKYFVSLDLNNNACLWNGTNLTLIQKLQIPSANNDNSKFSFNVCWIDESKFAITTPTNAIKIYAISDTPPGLDFHHVQLIGSLNGHRNVISSLQFDSQARLLASASDFDYIIKLWSSSSSQEIINLNVESEESSSVRNHSSPIVGLHWLDKVNDGSALLSISMEGIVNIWNAATGKSVLSTHLINNQLNYRPVEGQEPHAPGSLIFLTAISPNKRFVALGDDKGKVSVWDLEFPHGAISKSESLNCLGIYDPKNEHDGAGNGGGVGVCSITWNKTSNKISIAYKGVPSVIIDWQQS